MLIGGKGMGPSDWYLYSIFISHMPVPGLHGAPAEYGASYFTVRFGMVSLKETWAIHLAYSSGLFDEIADRLLHGSGAPGFIAFSASQWATSFAMVSMFDPSFTAQMMSTTMKLIDTKSGR